MEENTFDFFKTRERRMTERKSVRVGPLQRHIYPYSVAVDDLLTRTKQIIVDQDTGNF